MYHSCLKPFCNTWIVPFRPSWVLPFLVDFSFPFSCVFPVSWFLVVRIDRRLFKTVFMPGSRIGNADIAGRRPFHKLNTILLIINVLLHAGIEKMLIEYTLTGSNLFFKKKTTFQHQHPQPHRVWGKYGKEAEEIKFEETPCFFCCLYCRPDLVEEAVLAIYVIFSQRKHTSCQTERNG